MNRCFSSHPGCYYIYNRLRSRKHPPSESAPRMVKVAQVTAVGNTQQRTCFRHALSLAIPPNCRLKRGGQVESLDIQLRGKSVAQGQTLARLNAREAQQRVNERQTAATLAQRQFDRFQTLAGALRAISQAEMDVQRASRDAANAALKIAREELAQMSLIAPFSGIAAGVRYPQPSGGRRRPTGDHPDADRLCWMWSSASRNLFTSLDIRNTAYRPVVRSIPCRAASLPRNTKKAYRQQRQ